MGYFYNFELKNNTLCKVLHSSSNNRPPTVNNFQHLCNEPLLFFPSLLHLLYRSRTRYGPLSLLPPLRVALVVVVIFISSYAPWVFMQMVYFSPASFSAKMPRKEKCGCVCVCVCVGAYILYYYVEWICVPFVVAVGGNCMLLAAYTIPSTDNKTIFYLFSRCGLLFLYEICELRHFICQ